MRFQVREHLYGVRRGYAIYDTQKEEFVEAHLTLDERFRRSAVERLARSWNKYNGPPVTGLSNLLRFRP